MRYRFLTIRISHFCEKARWALDRSGVDYEERGYMPAMHFPAVMGALAGTGAGAAERTSTRFSTPLLMGEGGARWTHSREIARFACPDLFDDPEAEALADRFDAQVGPHTRRIVYHFMLPERQRMLELAQNNVSAAQATAFRFLLPIGVPMLRKSLGISERGYQRSTDALTTITDEVAERLSDGRRFLVGDRFSIADLTFAALMAPVLLPPEYGANLGTVENAPPGLRPVVEAQRQHPAGQFALRMFAEHRHERFNVAA